MKKLIYWVLKNLIYPSDVENVKSPEFLDYLSKDKDWLVRWEVANNFNTSPETLDFMSRDNDRHIRSVVAQHPNTSSETLKQMSIDEENDYIKYHIKNNPNCSKETYKYLSALEILKTLPKVST